MNAYFLDTPDRSICLRRAMLQRSLRTFLQKQGDIKVYDLPDSTSPLSEIESLSVFAKAKARSVSYFVGLPNAPQEMLGTNILILTRSLGEELQDFDRRNGAEETGSEYWGRNILQNFAKVILLERLNFVQSVGFAPYTKLLLSDRFPVTLGRQTIPAKARVLVFDHNRENNQEEVADRFASLRDVAEVIVFRPETEAGVDQALLPEADVHVHIDFSYSSPSAALTPFDSLAGGVYTIVLSEKGENVMATDSLLMVELGARSYTKSAFSWLDAIASCNEFLERANLMRQQNMAINPETHRFQRINDQYTETWLRIFKETLI